MGKEGMIYLIIEREFLKTKENIYKIGRTSQEGLDRIKQYPKGSKLILYLESKDSLEDEKELIKIFELKYKCMRDIGREYFEDNSKNIIYDITKYFTDKYYQESKNNESNLNEQILNEEKNNKQIMDEKKEKTNLKKKINYELEEGIEDNEIMDNNEEEKENEITYNILDNNKEEKKNEIMENILYYNDENGTEIIKAVKNKIGGKIIRDYKCINCLYTTKIYMDMLRHLMRKNECENKSNIIFNEEEKIKLSLIPYFNNIQYYDKKKFNNKNKKYIVYKNKFIEILKDLEKNKKKYCTVCNKNYEKKEDIKIHLLTECVIINCSK
jgi:hypothetical protein